jgi:hypothetical protein
VRRAQLHVLIELSRNKNAQLLVMLQALVQTDRHPPGWPSDLDERLLAAFLRLRPPRMDLLHDMGEEELFWLDGESLVFEACCNIPRLHIRQPLQVLGHFVQQKLPGRRDSS